LNIQLFWSLDTNKLVWISAVAVPILALICGIASRRGACKRAQAEQDSEQKSE
jgi:hypothetical protein